MTLRWRQFASVVKAIAILLMTVLSRKGVVMKALSSGLTETDKTTR